MSSSALQQTRRSPRTLRDLLRESSTSSPSPSIDGFKPLPRNPIPSTTMRSLIEMDLSSSSTRNSNRRILNSLLNALVKRLSSFAEKSPSILPRSLSRKSKSKNWRGTTEIKVPVRIKDIVRWRSFGDLEEDQRQPLDVSSASSSWSSSEGSSWSDSDFSSYDGNFVECSRNDVVEEKRFSPLVGADSVHATTGNSVGTKRDLSLRRQEEEQRSPVSVLQIEQHELCPFDQSLVNVQRETQKCAQIIQRINDLTTFDEGNDDIDEYEEPDRTEKMAWKLLHFAKSSGSFQGSEANYLNKLLLDFFKYEAKKRRIDQEDNEFECEIMRRAQDWLNGSFGDDLENSDKNACIRDMDKRERWNNFGEQKEELASEIESAILDNLIVEIFDVSFSYF
ncbi:uncharacterized protein LOC129299945 [Prosopis cineraria]|uniref:uncharacterized protein LOC129299945 n=1 Tax=Prosopis cineraria TaxID=364024 RepID=UPI00240F53C6|nr:uncharacterized protein LOC129299945 [Prosopis cineraria]